MKRDGGCNPVTHVLKAIEVFKRFGRRVANPDRQQGIMLQRLLMGRAQSYFGKGQLQESRAHNHPIPIHHIPL